MAFQRFSHLMTGTSPAAPGQAIVGSVLRGLQKFEWFSIDADLIGATGGTLDLYLQRQVATNVWLDWIHFPQLAAGAGAVRYSVSSQPSSSIVVVGKTADDGTTGAPALAANTAVGGHPGDQLRIVAVAGASTSAGATVNIYVNAYKGAF